MPEELRWSRLINFPGAVAAVPELPGVYAFGRVITVRGLPTAMEWVYVGESRSLRSRLTSHRAIAETNELLAEWLRVQRRDAEVWYSVTDADKRRDIEKELIRTLQPIFNRIKYKKGTHGY